jgi:hypothetical protein
MKPLVLLIPLIAACAPRPAASMEASQPLRRVPLEIEAALLDYGAGDAAVAGGQRVLVLAPPAPGGRGRRPPAEIKIPGRVHVGQPFKVEIRVARAAEGEVRRFRIRCVRPGLRLLDGDLVVTVGQAPAVRRAVADSPGPAGFDLDEIGD